MIYLGLRVTPVQIAAATAAEDADAVGISVLSGAHLPLARQVLDALWAAGVRAPPAVGGTIPPPRDVEALRRLGVAVVFPVGTPLPDAVHGMLQLIGAEAAAPGHRQR